MDSPTLSSDACSRLRYLVASEASSRPRVDYVAAVQHTMGMHEEWRRTIVAWMQEVRGAAVIAQACCARTHPTRARSGPRARRIRVRVRVRALQVPGEFRFTAATLHAAVNYMDRYLSSQAVHKTRLQLLAMVSLYVSAKFHETTPFTLPEVATFADGLYSAEHVMRLEQDLVQRLDWKLDPVTPDVVLQALLGLLPAKLRSDVHDVGGMLLDEALLHYDMLGFAPSTVATSAFLIALSHAPPEGVGRNEAMEAVTAPLAALGLLHRAELLPCMDAMLRWLVPLYDLQSAKSVPGDGPNKRRCTSPSSVAQLESLVAESPAPVSSPEPAASSNAP